MTGAVEIIEALMKKYKINSEEFIVNRVRGRPLFDMVVGVLLSQNTSDKNAMKALDRLRERFGDPLDPCRLKDLDPDRVAALIKPAGMYRVRARNLLLLADLFCNDEFADKLATKIKSLSILDARRTLMGLPGIGIKSADVILNQYFGKPVFAVDTHIRRISLRLGVVGSKDYLKISEWWMKNLPENMYLRAHLLLITHGRRICKARNPRCSECPIRNFCRYYTEHRAGSDE